ncbi:hypothetical protein BV25DRAFT_403953 [Artomyces pyxidatus]|uniref:Uncharacterized protein n=1 Tax=Artomyces pyxidatus TaxID=48021 RepID=A0ACB8T5B6_9AGAM|nr:hypothetical protein BV25DRAFT_403953 [Artomyces pyxidatus]
MAETALFSVMQLHAPILERLVWDFQQASYSSSPPRLCLDHTPHLQDLDIKNVYWSPFTPEWTTHTCLTHLSIISGVRRGTTFDHDELFKVLTKLPQLKSLVLRTCLKNVEESTRHRQPVTPAHLSYLDLADNVYICAPVMQQLRVPNVSLKVSLGSAFRLNEHGPQYALQLLMAHQDNFTTPLLKAVIEWTKHLQVSAWRNRDATMNDSSTYDLANRPDFRVSLQYLGARTDATASVLLALPLHDIRVLHIVAINRWG